MRTAMDDVQRLLDEAAIRRVFYRYCRGIDRIDAELIRSAYWPGATDDHGVFRGSAEEFASWVVGVLANFEQTQHSLHQTSMDIVGERAFAETYFDARHLVRRENRLTLETFGGRYVDRLERRDGEWRIAHRVVVHDWSRIEAVPATYPNEMFAQGLRSRDDVSYRRD